MCNLLMPHFSQRQTQVTQVLFLTIICLSTFFYSVIYGLFTIRQQTQKENVMGHSLLLYPIVWGLICIALFQLFPDQLVRGVIVADTVRHALLITFLVLTYKRYTGKSVLQMSFFSVLFVSSTIALVLDPMRFSNTVVLIGFSGIFITLLQLFLIERVYASMSSRGDVNVKIIIVTAAWTIADIILYSEVAITQQLNPEHLFWRSVLLLTSLPVFWGGIGRLHTKSSKLEISRPLAYQGTIFTIAGFYLIAMGVVAYIFERTDFEWSQKTTGAAFAISMLPLMFMITSKKIRRNIKIFVNKNLFAAQFDYRETWLQLNESLDITLSGQGAYDRALTSALFTIDHRSGAYLSISQTGKHSLLSKSNMPLNTENISDISNLQSYFESKRWIINVEEASEQDDEYSDICNEVAQHLKKLLHLKVKWLIPVFRGGEYVALWVVGDAELKSWNLNWETRDFLSAVAQQIDSYMVNLENKQTISEHAQLAAFHQMSAFVIHDLKNVKAQLSMLIQNGEKHKRNPDFVDDLFVTLNATQTRMDKMLGQLTNKQQVTSTSSTQSVIAALKSVVNTTMLQGGLTPALHVATTDEPYAFFDAEKFKNVLMHLINNAQHACSKSIDAKIDILCDVSEKYVTILITDNGEGMTEEFVKTRLFKPFETTKGNSGMGLGVYDARCFAQDLGGDLTVSSKIREGTQFIMTIQRSGT